jgi:hypothetical protein
MEYWSDGKIEEWKNWSDGLMFKWLHFYPYCKQSIFQRPQRLPKPLRSLFLPHYSINPALHPEHQGVAEWG